MGAIVTARILWAAIFASTFFLLVVLFVMSPTGEVDPVIPVVMLVTAAGTASASIFIPRVAHAAALRQLQIDAREEDDPAGMPGVTKRRVAARPAEAMRKAVAAYQTPLILGLSLSESVALFGFVLGFLGAPLALVLPFFAVSWVLIAVRFPTLERALGPAERATGVHIPRDR